MVVTKSLRNRIVGLLVLISLVLILVPAMMDSNKQVKSKTDSIAINRDGAVTDDSGQLVTADNGEFLQTPERDYSDMLSPYDDTAVAEKRDSPADIAAKNSASGNSNNVSSFNSVAGTPASGNSASGSLEIAKPFNAVKPSYNYNDEQATSAPSNSVITQSHNTGNAASSQSKSEILVPRGKQSKEADKAKTYHKAESVAANSGLSSGKFAVQIGAFAYKEKADSALNSLKSKGFNGTTQQMQVNGRRLIKVYAGIVSSRNEAKILSQKVQSLGFSTTIVAL